MCVILIMIIYINIVYMSMVYRICGNININTTVSIGSKLVTNKYSVFRGTHISTYIIILVISILKYLI